jgi:hypothetical protein
MAGQRPGGARARPARRGRPGVAQAGPLFSWAESRHCGQAGEVPAAARSSPVHAAPADGTPTWQIILIAAPAALFAAALAVTAYRIQAARRRETTTAT